ncbi:MAG: uracil-DNA glycosylase family protein [Promethearchaeota archaeon]
MKMELLELKEQVENCKKCELWKGRTKPVFGEGPDYAKIMLIGLGPGYHEDKQGLPFVGAAGKLLNELLSSAGLKREEVYIANIIKSYLPDNKATKEQITACTPYLDKQMEIIKPKIIILLGNVAVKYIFEKYQLPLASMRDLHTKTFIISTLDFSAKVIPMYHPSAALRNPGLRDIIIEDWVKLKEKLH